MITINNKTKFGHQHQGINVQYCNKKKKLLYHKLL